MNHGTFFDPHSVVFKPTTTNMENKRDDKDGEKLKIRIKRKRLRIKKILLTVA